LFFTLLRHANDGVMLSLEIPGSEHLKVTSLHLYMYEQEIRN